MTQIGTDFSPRWEEAFDVWSGELRRRHAFRTQKIIGRNQFGQIRITTPDGAERVFAGEAQAFEPRRRDEEAS